MTLHALLQKEQQETQAIIDELIADGSDPYALYSIEHHVSSESLIDLEQFLAQMFKLGYEISDITSIEVQDDLTLYCCDLVTSSPLDQENIMKQVEQIILLTHNSALTYDGWGTFFVDDEESEDDEDEETILQ